MLYVEDAGRAVEWYARLGFAKEWEQAARQLSVSPPTTATT